jgi:DNA-binding transcriptional ArsR family regulator
MVSTRAESPAEQGGFGDRVEALLTTLSDPKCRAILLTSARQPMTASELSEELDLPISTVYRKLNHLTDLPLLEETTDLTPDGKHPHRYECRIDEIRVSVATRDGETTDVAVSF